MMAIIKTCCCKRNLRSGSFASGIYTLVLYTIILTGGAFHVHTVLEDTELFSLSFSMLICSGMCVIASVLLLVGLCVDSRLLLWPWILSVSMTTMLDILLSIYLIVETPYNLFLWVLFAIDIFICLMNLYCLLCVISQYQELLAGRGRPGQPVGYQGPPVRFQATSGRALNGRSPKTGMDTTTVNSPSSGCHLLPPSPTLTFESRSHPSTEVSFISEDASVQDASHRGSWDGHPLGDLRENVSTKSDTGGSIKVQTQTLTHKPSEDDSLEAHSHGETEPLLMISKTLNIKKINGKL